MDYRAIRKQCEARVRELVIPVPFEIRAFCATLGDQRGRPLHLRPMRMLPGASGVWLATDTDDYILFEERSTEYHQRLIILHEIAHLLCDHKPGQRVSHESLEQSFIVGRPASVNPRRLHTVMRRHAYSSAEELEAELLACLILERVQAAPEARPAPADPVIARLLHRLEVSLEDRDEGSL